MSAFSDIGYHDADPEEVEHVPGSVTTEGYRNVLAHRPASVAHIRATSAGDAALERIKGILRERQGRHGRGQSTTPARQVSTDAYWSSISRTVRGFA
jgi:hypothetical protein